MEKKKSREVYSWECHFCHKIYPNTLCFCPQCNIARQHSKNVRDSDEKAKRRKEGDSNRR